MGSYCKSYILNQTIFLSRYGFRGNPQLWLVAKPKVGEREVTVSHITDWIEKKLSHEFQVGHGNYCKAHKKPCHCTTLVIQGQQRD